VIIENNTAVGVKMKNGDELRAKVIVSNVGVNNTYKKLIKSHEYLPDEMLMQLEALKPSVSHVALYIGLSASDEFLKLPKNNFWVYNNYNFDEGIEKANQNLHTEPPLAYISFPSAKDPLWDAKFPNRATIQILGVGCYANMAKWEKTSWLKRDNTYANYKDFVKERFLEKIVEIFPQIKGYIDVCEVSTPLTTKHFSNYQSGEIYGLEHSPERFNAKWLRPRTPIKNFYLTGQDIVAVGIASAVLSGVFTSVAILRKNIYGKLQLKKEKVTA
jgi:all-trans-retinol 13,14-reductase